MANLRTLIVDDNDTDRMIVKAILSRVNFASVHEAENGSIGKKKIIMSLDLGAPYDLILLDWNMPFSNGDILLQYIRSNRALKHTKVIIMTATAEKKIVEAAIEAGVDDFIVKPVTLDLLQDKLAKLLFR